MKIPLEIKRLRARSLWSVVRFVVVMLRRRIAVKKLQRVAVDLHMKYFGGDKFKNIGGNFNDHYEFSCSSSPAGIFKAPASTSSILDPVVNSGSRRKNWDGRFLLKALVSSCTGSNVKSDLESESDCVGFPQFIACNEDGDDQYFSYIMDPRFSNSNESPASDSCTYVSTTRCSNCSLSSEIDRQAEEFISSFYQEMRLQRQDSYGKCQEMLARGSR